MLPAPTAAALWVLRQGWAAGSCRGEQECRACTGTLLPTQRRAALGPSHSPVLCLEPTPHSMVRPRPALLRLQHRDLLQHQPRGRVLLAGECLSAPELGSPV